MHACFRPKRTHARVHTTAGGLKKKHGYLKELGSPNKLARSSSSDASRVPSPLRTRPPHPLRSSLRAPHLARQRHLGGRSARWGGGGGGGCGRCQWGRRRKAAQGASRPGALGLHPDSPPPRHCAESKCGATRCPPLSLSRRRERVLPFYSPLTLRRGATRAGRVRTREWVRSDHSGRPSHVRPWSRAAAAELPELLIIPLAPPAPPAPAPSPPPAAAASGPAAGEEAWSALAAQLSSRSAATASRSSATTGTAVRVTSRPPHTSLRQRGLRGDRSGQVVHRATRPRSGEARSLLCFDERSPPAGTKHERSSDGWSAAEKFSRGASERARSETPRLGRRCC